MSLRVTDVAKERLEMGLAKHRLGLLPRGRSHEARISLFLGVTQGKAWCFLSYNAIPRPRGYFFVSLPPGYRFISKSPETGAKQ